VAKFGQNSDAMQCSFCGKSQRQVSKLIAGPGVYICNECVNLCNDIIETEGVVVTHGAEESESPLVGEEAGRAGGKAGRSSLMGELRSVQRQLHELARQVASLVERTRENDGVETLSGTVHSGAVPGPTPASPAFPESGSLPEGPEEHRVQLHYDRGADRLTGTLGDQRVEWDLERHHGLSGRIGDIHLEASWTTGDSYVPEPGGWTPSPDYVSDFPNIPADLRGTFAHADAELHGVFHLAPDYLFKRGSLAGYIGNAHLEATARAVGRGLDDGRTVAVEGTYGPVSFALHASIDDDLCRGMVYGRMGQATVWLELNRPTIQREVPLGPGAPPIDYPGPEYNLSGSYDGPPELLAIMAGALVRFM
jgi:hypothetical protein